MKDFDPLHDYESEDSGSVKSTKFQRRIMSRMQIRMSKQLKDDFTLIASCYEMESSDFLRSFMHWLIVMTKKYSKEFPPTDHDHTFSKQLIDIIEQPVPWKYVLRDIANLKDNYSLWREDYDFILKPFLDAAKNSESSKEL